MSVFPCKSCEYSGRTIYADPCAQCANDYIRSGVATKFEKSKAKTNFQMLKEMNEEELAEFIWKTGRLGQTFGPCGFKLWLEWMREEAET